MSASPGSSPCWTRPRCCCPASSWCSWSAWARTSRSRGDSAGELVAFYGYATFLVLPLRTATEFANQLMRGLVAAVGSSACSRSSPTSPSPTRSVRLPDGGDLVDPVRAPCPPRPAHRDRLRRARRLGGAGRPSRAVRRGLSECRYGGVPLASCDACGRPRADPGERHRRDPVHRAPARGARRRRPAADDEIMAAMRTASAEDVLVALPDGLDSEVEERAGRSPAVSGSGWCWCGRCWRTRPCSCWSSRPRGRRAHRGADRGPAAGLPGRPEHVVITASPLLLDRVDEVIFVAAAAWLPRASTGAARHRLPRGRRRDVARETKQRGAIDEADPARRRASRDPAPLCPPGCARRHSARAVRLALLLHGLAAVSGLAAPRLIGDLVEDVQHGTTAAKVDQVISLIAVFVLGAVGADPVGAVQLVRRSASRCWPSCGRTSSTMRSPCRSARSSGPAPVTC